jgi:hypothetical protein
LACSYTLMVRGVGAVSAAVTSRPATAQGVPTMRPALGGRQINF